MVIFSEESWQKKQQLKKTKRVGGGPETFPIFMCKKNPQESAWASDRRIFWHSGLRVLLMSFSLMLLWYTHLIYQSWTRAAVSQEWHMCHRLLHLLMLEFLFFNPLWLLLLNWQIVKFKLKQTLFSWLMKLVEVLQWSIIHLHWLPVNTSYQTPHICTSAALLGGHPPGVSP